MDIFNFFGSILGYLLWFLYTIFNNYGISIIIFTVIVKALLFPFSLKSHRSMSGQSRLSEKQKEIQKRCGNDRARYTREVQELYQKEGVTPGGGCLTSLIPLPIMFGIFYSVTSPLRNTLHIAGDTVDSAINYLARLPGMASSGQYIELQIIRNWDELKSSLTMFTAADVEKIESFADGFTFLGLDLLSTPQGASLLSFLWIIPVLSLLSSWAMQFLISRTSAVKQVGCMKYMMYGMAFITAYWGYIMPAAVGIYWVCSNAIQCAQSVLMAKFFSPQHVAAMNEARKFVSLELSEQNIKPLPANVQNQIAQKIQSQTESIAQKQQKQTKQNTAKKKTSKGNKNSNNYLGNKK